MPRVPQMIPAEVLPDVDELAEESGLDQEAAWRMFLRARDLEDGVRVLVQGVDRGDRVGL